MVIQAASNEGTKTHEAFDLFLAMDASNNQLIAASTVGYGTNLQDGATRKEYTVQVNTDQFCHLLTR